jgi:ABC-type antimicrobial peptide transport system permease subunit
MTVLLLLALSVSVAMGANVFYRCVALRREIATRRVLGARRRDIVRMLVLESMGPISLGSIAGSILTLIYVALSSTQTSGVALLGAAVGIAASGVAGAYLAARYASNTPLHYSGLFRGAPDKRGEV